MSIDDSDDMRREIAWMCSDMMGTEDNEITNNCFDQWIEMINSGDGGDDGGDGMGCPPGLTELQCDNLMSCMDENGNVICSMLEFQRNLYNICNDDDSHEFCYYSDEEGREMFNAAFAYEDGVLSAEDFMELIVDSMFGDDTGMGGEMYVIYDGVEITIGAEDEGEYVIDIDTNCYQIEEDEWECFYPHYVMLMDSEPDQNDIVTVKQDYCEWDSEDITNVECNSEIRVDLSEGTYNLVTATGCYNEWDEATEEMGDLICDQTGEYNYTMYWAEDMDENWNIIGSVDDDSPVMEFDYMDYMEFSQGDYGFAPVYETYEFNVGPDGFEGDIFSYQYRWENSCEDDCESGGNMILWIYEYSFNPDNTVDNLMAVSGHNDYDEDDEYYCCYSMLDLELTEGTYVFVMSGDYTHMISDDWSTLYHETIISEHVNEDDLAWYGTLDSNDSRAYFPSNYYDYEGRGDDNGDGDEMWLFMAMIENVTAYQDGDITAVEAANNFIDLMYVADAMGLYDDNDGDGDGYWESWNYCEWEGDDWEGDTMWYCTDNANGNDDFDDWWYYCEEFEDIWYCTDDFGQSPDYEFSADNTHYKEGGRPDGGDGGGDDGDCPFDSMDFCYEIGPYCAPESGDYDPAYCGAESAHYCLEDGANDEGCAEIDDLEAACAAGEVPQVICDAFLNFDHDAYHAGDDEDDHSRLDGIIGTEDPPNADPVISPTNIVGALSDNEGLPMMYTGSFKLKFEGVDASLETHEAYLPVGDDDGGMWHVGINLLDGYEVLSCKGCGDTLEIEGSNAKFSTMESVTITFGKVVEVDTNECDQIVTIGDDGYSFEPADITIAAGDTVCWMWKDTTDAHNVAEIATKFDADMNLEDAKIGFYSGEAANSVDFRHTFEENDKTHYYVCEPHATMGMAGIVTVGNGTDEDPIQAIAEESGLPSIGFIVGVLTLVGAAGLRRRIR
jgi:plastocyanin